MDTARVKEVIDELKTMSYFKEGIQQPNLGYELEALLHEELKMEVVNALLDEMEKIAQRIAALRADFCTPVTGVLRNNSTLPKVNLALVDSLLKSLDEDITHLEDITTGIDERLE